MRIVKGNSSEWINKNQFTESKFQWQEGYGAFSYSKSQIPAVDFYIQNQQAHHSKQTFLEEFQDFLKKLEIDYDKRFVFKPLF